MAQDGDGILAGADGTAQAGVLVGGIHTGMVVLQVTIELVDMDIRTEEDILIT